MKQKLTLTTDNRLTVCECCGQIAARRNRPEQLCNDCRREIEAEDARRQKWRD